MGRSNEYMSLLAKREAIVVLGRRFINLWLLTAVLTATFVAIAFSEGSLNYLNEKMNDPFTNWVNIANLHNGNNFDRMREDLDDAEKREYYGYLGVQSDYYWDIPVFTHDKQGHDLECRFFERMDNELTKAIIDSVSNAWNNCTIGYDKLNSDIEKGEMGFIITEEALFGKLGYSRDSVPTYIYVMGLSPGADSLGVKLYTGGYAEAPVPILAIVKHLPMNMEAVGTALWYSQFSQPVYNCFNMNREQYARELNFFVSKSVAKDVEAFESLLREKMPKSLRFDVIESDRLNNMTPWKEGFFVAVDMGDDTAIVQRQRFASLVSSMFSEYDVCRVCNYQLDRNLSLNDKNYVSVNFAKLDSIRAFEKYIKKNFGIQVEMSQVNSKENFNAVSVMASILSIAMVIFSLVSIILFIVNMMQNYFQKVKRNLGTFKAFGFSTSELIKVYVFILLSIVVTAIVIACVAAFVIQECMSWSGVVRDNGMGLLELFCLKTLCAIIIIIVVSVFTVYVVMKRLLQQTPGNLIYDR